MEHQPSSDINSKDWILINSHSKHSLPRCFSVIPPKPTIITKGDSAASNHYFALRDAEVLDNVHFDDPPTSVLLPDSSSIASVANGHLPLSSSLTPTSTKTTIFPNLQSSLISLGQLCDDDCTVILDKRKLRALKNNEVILEGSRSTSGDGLWDIPLPQPPRNVPRACPTNITAPSMNVILRKNQPSKDLVRYLHASCFSPPIKTFLSAVQNKFLITFPGLSVSLIKKHLSPSISTAKGHMKQEQQGLQSTKVSSPTQDPVSTVKTHDVIYALVSSKDKAYMDLTGRFPYCSSRGNEYLLISYHYDANAIQGIPLQNRKAATITNGWLKLHQRYDNAGIPPNTWILDNETSRDLKAAMSKKRVDFQLVPPHNHRANAAERAIQAFKNHFKAGLASLDPNFPVSEWDRLLPQAFLTLNLLRPSRLNPKLSAEAYLNGQFDFNASPLAPPGTKVAVHSKPGQRNTWDPNCKEGWYVGPALEHYRCAQCYMPATRSVVTSDTVLFLPHEIPFPEVKIDDFLRQAATDLISILTHPPPSTVPSLEAGDATKNALLKLALLLNPSDDITTKIQRQNSISLATAQSLHRQASSSSQQPSSSPKPPRHPSSRPASTATPIPPPVLTPEQKQRLKDILTRTITAITHDKLKSTLQSYASHQKPYSFRHRAATALLAHHLFQPSMSHIYNAQGKNKV